MSVEEKKISAEGPKDEKESVFDCKDFDLTKYIKEYQGPTKVKRLLFIARKCPSLRLEAYRLAISELKKGRNTQKYASVVSEARETLGAKLGEKWVFDEAWYDSTRREYHEKENQLDTKVYMHKRDEDPREETLEAIKNHIEYLQDSGYYSEAQGKIRTCKDYIHKVEDEFYLKLIEIENAAHLDFGEFLNTMYSIPPKWSSTMQNKFGSKKTVEAKIAAISGLYSLHRSTYDNAASHFTSVGFDLKCPTIISKRDVAIYGTLCAMASYRRAQLKRELSGEFKKFMILVPGLADMVQNFVQCKFRSAFEYLEKLEPNLKLDCYISKHLPSLRGKIQELAVVQYFEPFSHARISRMAVSFGMSQSKLEKLLVKLIESGSVKARIDNFNKVVIAQESNSREELFDKAIKRGVAYVRDLRTLLMRMSLAANDFSVSPFPQGRNQGGSQSSDIKRMEIAADPL